MSSINFYEKSQMPTPKQKEEIVDFLFQSLQQYGDPKQDIEKAMNYAFSVENKPGGFVSTLSEDNQIVCAAVINKTGMDGYIPENILVYIATDANQRGKGIGKKMMKHIIDKAEGSIALHVEPDNPAKILYEKLGFTNKYLEMRLKKEK